MPLAVDQDFAVWLRGEALYSTLFSSGLSSGLYTDGLSTTIITGIETEASADAELARQLAVLGLPLAVDRHTVIGQYGGLIGRPITLTGDFLGYSAGVTVFVIGAEEQASNLTELRVIRRLA